MLPLLVRAESTRAPKPKRRPRDFKIPKDTIITMKRYGTAHHKPKELGKSSYQ
jgi:hypothetical protein